MKNASSEHVEWEAVLHSVIPVEETFASITKKEIEKNSITLSQADATLISINPIQKSSQAQPSERLFFRGIPFETTGQEFRKLLEPFGKTKQTINLIESRGIFFATFVFF